MDSSYHSIASSSPSPLIAEVLKIAQVLFLRAESPRAVEISEGVIAPSMSFRCGERRRRQEEGEEEGKGRMREGSKSKEEEEGKEERRRKKGGRAGKREMNKKFTLLL